MKALLILSFLIFLVRPVSAQNVAFSDFLSADHALYFPYPDDWSLVRHSIVFDAHYAVELSASAIVPGEPACNRGCPAAILLDMVHSHVVPGLEDVDSAYHYADQLLAEPIVEHRELEVSSYPAAWITPTDALMSLSNVWMFDHAVPEPLTAIHLGDESLLAGRLMIILRDDGWVLIIRVITPGEVIDTLVESAQHMATHVSFDPLLASTPLPGNLPSLDISGIRLTNVFVTDDQLLTFLYPDTWVLLESTTVGEPSLSAIDALFSLPGENTEAVIHIWDSTGDYGAQESQANPFEYAQAVLLYPEGTVAQYRIGDRLGISVTSRESNTVQQTISMMLNDHWIASGKLRTARRITADQHASEIAAVLESVSFALGESWIRSPVVSVSLPEEWIFASNRQTAHVYGFVLHPRALTETGDEYINILIVDITETALQDSIEREGIGPILESLAVSDGAEFTPSEAVEIGEYQAAHIATHVNEQQYREYFSLMVGEDWLMLITGAAPSIEKARETVPCIDRILEQAEFTLPH